MAIHRLILMLLGLLVSLSTGCATATTDPASVTYFLDRTDYAGGDNGYAVPIATCTEGTLFATFTSGHRIETETMDTLAKVDTGEGPLPLWSLPAKPFDSRNDWPGGHKPHLTLYPVQVPTVPLFLDDVPQGTLKEARLEGHEKTSYRDGKHFPVLLWERCDLETGQERGFLRVDRPGVYGHHGDSGVPRFVILEDGSLAFLTLEIFRSGGGANHKVYLDLLARAREKDPSVTWKTVRWVRAGKDRK